MVKYSNPQGFSIKSEEGKVIDTVAPSEETAKAWKKDQTVYRDTETKQWAATPNSSVKLGNDGKIHVTIPKSYMNDKEHLASILDSDSMAYLSSLYKANKEASVTMSDGTEKKVSDLVDEYDKAIKSYDKAMVGLSDLKTNLKNTGRKELADKITLDIYQILGANGLGSKKDESEDSWLAIPNEILNNKKWSFLKDFNSFNAEKQMVKTKEFLEKYYKLDAGRDLFGDNGISAIQEAAVKAVGNAGAKDPADWARAEAFYQFVSNKKATEDFWNKLAVTGWATGEGIARATAIVVPAALNAVWNFGSWVISYANPRQISNLWGDNYNPESTYSFLFDPIDNIANFVGGTLGIGELVPDGMHFDQILADQYSDRTQFYQATNSSAAGAFILSYIGTSFYEGYLVGKAETQVLANLIAIPSIGQQLKGAAKNARTLETATGLGNTLEIDVEGNLIRLGDIENSRSAFSTGVTALTGKTNPTLFDAVRTLVSTDPQATLNGAVLLQSQFGAAGKLLRAQALNNLTNLTNYYSTISKQMKAAGMTKEAIEATAEFANVIKEANTIKSVLNVANQWYSTSVSTARAFSTMQKIASVMPAMVMIGETVFGAAAKNPEAVRAILNGNASDEDKEWAIQQLAVNVGAYAIGFLASKAIGKFSKSKPVEIANVKLTRGMATISESVTNFTDAVKVKLYGSDWRYSITNPTKKEVVFLNQLEAAAQSWVAHAADGLKGETATLATQKAIAGLQKTSNVITDFEPQRGVRRTLDIYHSNAFPAYNEASSTTAKVNIELSKLLDKHNIDTPTQPEALVGGSDATLGMPLDLTRYMSRLLLVQQYRNIMGGKENLSSLSSVDTKEYTLSKEVVRDVESRYPREITNHIKNKVIPALKAEARELMSIEQAEGVGRRSRQEGFKEATRFGKSGEDWFPIMRITDAQKSYEEGLKMLSNNKTLGTIAVRNLKTDFHYTPGSETMTDFVHPALVLQRRALDIATRATMNRLVDLTKENPMLKRTTLMSGKDTERMKTFEDLQPSFKRGLDEALNGIKDDAAEMELVKDAFEFRKTNTAIDKASKRIEKAGDNLAKAMAEEELPITNTDKLKMIKALTSDDIAGILGKKSVQEQVKNANDFYEFLEKSDKSVKKIIRGSINANIQVMNSKAPDSEARDLLDWRSRIYYRDYRRATKFDADLEDNINKSIISTHAKENCL